MIVMREIIERERKINSDKDREQHREHRGEIERQRGEKRKRAVRAVASAGAVEAAGLPSSPCHVGYSLWRA